MSEFDPNRYRLLPAVARQEGIGEGTLRSYARTVSDLAARRLGRVFVDVEVLQQLLRPSLLVPQPANPSAPSGEAP